MADLTPVGYAVCCSLSTSSVFSQGRGQASCRRESDCWCHLAPKWLKVPGMGWMLGTERGHAEGGCGRELILHPTLDTHPSWWQELAWAGAHPPWRGGQTFSEVKNISSSVKPRQCSWLLNSSSCSLLALGVRAARETVW